MLKMDGLIAVTTQSECERAENYILGDLRKMIKFKKLHSDAKIPTRATLGSAGFDLSYCGDSIEILHPGQRRLFKTGIACKIPANYCGQIWPRSGLALKHAVDVLAGLIDNDYRKEVCVILINHDEERPFQVLPGDRVAQLVVVPFLGGSEWVTDLEETDRGGFGSTGR